MLLLQRKALYNLIQLNLARIEAGELKIGNLQTWQIANYRDTPAEELFLQLNALGVSFGKEHFELFGKKFEAPEEMVENLAKEREPLEQDQIFLILFELWRRFFPEKRSISIFCDELDYQMTAYDLEKPNAIADTLAYLQQLLEEHVDRGLEPKQAFAIIQTYCANDIESFLFDYILNAIEGGNQRLATELLDGFGRFVSKEIWFKYLSARAEILSDPEEGYEQLEKIINQLSSDTHLDLVEEMLFFLANSGNHSLFYTLAKKTIPLLKKEEDFRVYLEACYSHYDYLELKQPSLAIAFLFHSRASIPPETPLLPSDPGILEIRAIIDQKLHFAAD
jgi:hypothetical protein